MRSRLVSQISLKRNVRHLATHIKAYMLIATHILNEVTDLISGETRQLVCLQSFQFFDDASSGSHIRVLRVYIIVL